MRGVLAAVCHTDAEGEDARCARRYAPAFAVLNCFILLVFAVVYQASSVQSQPDSNFLLLTWALCALLSTAAVVICLKQCSPLVAWQHKLALSLLLHSALFLTLVLYVFYTLDQQFLDLSLLLLSLLLFFQVICLRPFYRLSSACVLLVYPVLSLVLVLSGSPEHMARALILAVIGLGLLELGRLLASGFQAVKLRKRDELANEHEKTEALSRERTLQDRLRERSQETLRLEDELEIKRKQLEEAWRLAREAQEIKGRFLANISHEIRTPMNGVIGMLDLMLDTAKEEEQRGHLETAKVSADNLLAVLNDLLDFTKIESGKLELREHPFELRAFIETLGEFLTERMKQNDLIFVANIEEDVPNHLIGDPERLRQVLVNLFGNAVKFTEAGGAVVLFVWVCSMDANDVVLTFSISDTGIGIPPEKQEEIFRSFTQVDDSDTRRFGGSGLGLTISSRLVSLMGGRMTVESLVDRGSVFQFTAQFTTWNPLEKQDGVVRHPSSKGVVRLPVLPLKILLAEDNRINQKVAVRMLQHKGHSVIVAENGLQALDRLAEDSFDLVLMDVQMPEMDGFAAVNAIRESERDSGQHIPIVALTAHAMVGDRERCLEAGMDDYLSKPIDKNELDKILFKISMLVQTAP